MKALTALAIALLAAMPLAAAEKWVARTDPAGEAGRPVHEERAPGGLAYGADPYFSEPELLRIRAAVRGQIVALAARDGEAAFAHLAPSAQAYYATPTGFLRSLSKDMAPIMATASFAFAEVERDSTDAVQLVQLTAADGTRWLARFTLERQSDGAWAIKRCLVEAGDLEPRV